MDSDKIILELQREVYHPIYFLHGEEPYYIDRISDFIEKNVLDEGEKAFNQIVLYGKETDFKTVIDEARQYPMMSRYRVVIVKEAQDMKSLPELVTYVEKPSPTTLLVLCHKYKKLDKRTRFAKLIDEKGLVFESKKLYENQVSSWVTSYIKELGISAEQGVADLLAEYLGADLSKISNELDKLVLNLGGHKKLTQQDVREQIGISKDFDVFELQKAFGERNFVKAHLIIRYFSANPAANPVIMVVASLYSYFNKMAVVKYHQSANDQELARLAGVSPYFVKEYKASASRYSFSHLRQIFMTLKECDKASKGVGSRHGNDESILKDLLVACMYA